VRRPLNWGLASFALLALPATYHPVGPQPLKPAGEVVVMVPTVMPDIEVRGSAAVQHGARATLGASPFAYVREDGSEVFLPVDEARGQPPGSFEALHADSGFQLWQSEPAAQDGVADLETAVYTWSSPVVDDRPIYR
jgi:hypothetical protein